MLELTGFTWPDIGSLVITEKCRRRQPADVTRDDLEDMAKYLSEFYTTGAGRGLVKRLFPNSGFDQPSWATEQFKHRRDAWADFVLRGFDENRLEPALEAMGKDELRSLVLRGKADAPPCIFSGKPAYLRVSRTMVPMLNARETINFSPQGTAGIPVSAEMLLAIHAMPLGCLSTQGKLLAVESDDIALMREFVRMHLAKHERFANLASHGEYKGYINMSSYKSHLIGELVEALKTAELQTEGDKRVPSLTTYFFTNDNQGAEITVNHLPSSTVQFVRSATSPRHASAWNQIVRRSWIEDKPEAEEERLPVPKITGRYLIYEELFDLPENANLFLRTYFLRHPLKKFKRDPRGEYNVLTEADLVSWDLTALFLKGVMQMDQSRIDALRTLGDRLAMHIIDNEDRKLLNTLFYATKYEYFRRTLLKRLFNYSNDDPLVTFDGYVEVFHPFEEGISFERADWSLARDLLLIRIFEQLQRNGALAAAANALQDADPDDSHEPVS